VSAPANTIGSHVTRNPVSGGDGTAPIYPTPRGRASPASSFRRIPRAGGRVHRSEVRTRSGRSRRPTAAIGDSSSVKASPVAEPRALAAHEGFVYPSHIALPPRRFDRSQLFDAL